MDEDDLLPAFLARCVADLASLGAEETYVVSLDGCANYAAHVAVGVLDINNDGSHE